jgi:hypothetical protein
MHPATSITLTLLALLVIPGFLTLRLLRERLIAASTLAGLGLLLKMFGTNLS